MKDLLYTAGSLLLIFVLNLIILLFVLVPFFHPRPICPDGYVIAGREIGGVYHCVLGVEPIQ